MNVDPAPVDSLLVHPLASQVSEVLRDAYELMRSRGAPSLDRIGPGDEVTFGDPIEHFAPVHRTRRVVQLALW